jgi:hypothetical protein
MMHKTEALLRTLFILGMILFILWMIQSHSAPYGLVVKPVYQILIVLIAIALAPFVYQSFLKLPSQKEYTRDDYLKRAIGTGCLALVFAVLAIFNPGRHETDSVRWLGPAGFVLATAISLILASKAKNTEYTRHE